MIKALALAFLTLTLFAKTDFTGHWKLNTAKSEFGPFPAPSSMTQKVTHQDPSLKLATKMATDNGDFEFESNYTTDGKECSNQFGPNEMKSTLKWEGDVLVINTKGTFGDTELTMQDKWETSSDGKILTIKRHFSSSRGEVDQRLVLER